MVLSLCNTNLSLESCGPACRVDVRGGVGADAEAGFAEESVSSSMCPDIATHSLWAILEVALDAAMPVYSSFSRPNSAARTSNLDDIRKLPKRNSIGLLLNFRVSTKENFFFVNRHLTHATVEWVVNRIASYVLAVRNSRAYSDLFFNASKYIRKVTSSGGSALSSN